MKRNKSERERMGDKNDKTNRISCRAIKKAQSKGVLYLTWSVFSTCVRYGDLCLRHTPTGCLSGFSCFFVVGYITPSIYIYICII